jgi:hypothetical protein
MTLLDLYWSSEGNTLCEEFIWSFSSYIYEILYYIMSCRVSIWGIYRGCQGPPTRYIYYTLPLAQQPNPRRIGWENRPAQGGHNQLFPLVDNPALIQLVACTAYLVNFMLHLRCDASRLGHHVLTFGLLLIPLGLCPSCRPLPHLATFSARQSSSKQN